MIVAAATKHPGGDNADLVIVGLHHAQCIHALYFITGHKTGGQIEQGFLTTKGRFVDRKEAAQIALSTGQIKSLQWPEYGELFSEDLNYPDGPPKR
jgi:hypothetical protein